MSGAEERNVQSRSSASRRTGTGGAAARLTRRPARDFQFMVAAFLRCLARPRAGERRSFQPFLAGRMGWCRRNPASCCIDQVSLSFFPLAASTGMSPHVPFGRLLLRDDPAGQEDCMNLLVTITFNALKDEILDPFFACFAAQTSRDCELLVIDNASSDGTRDYLAALDLPNVTVVLNEENVGFARACNQGISLARSRGAEYVTFLNNDTEFGSHLFKEMTASIEKTGAAGLSPLISYHSDPERIWFVTGSYRWKRGIIPYHDHINERRDTIAADRIQKTAFAPGCCLMLRMDVFDNVVGFDERYFVYWEDADLCRDLGRRGYTIVVDTALACIHKVSTSTGGAFSDFSILHFHRGHMLFVRKHYGLIGLFYAIPVSIAKTLANVVRRRMRPRQLRIFWRGLLSGLKA
jgi:GT2 family glycosyltransferase